MLERAGDQGGGDGRHGFVGARLGDMVLQRPLGILAVRLELEEDLEGELASEVPATQRSPLAVAGEANIPDEDIHLADLQAKHLVDGVCDLTLNFGRNRGYVYGGVHHQEELQLERVRP